MINKRNKWLYYEKKTTYPDGSIGVESGPTWLGDVVQSLQMIFWMLASLLFWIVMLIPVLIFGPFERMYVRWRNRNAADDDFPPFPDESPWWED